MLHTMSTSELPTVTEPPHFCLKCREQVKNLKYHNRIRHQDTVRLETREDSFTLRRTADTGTFICPTCGIFGNKDPDKIRVSPCIQLRAYP